jgi:hypothetical protein
MESQLALRLDTFVFYFLAGTEIGRVYVYEGFHFKIFIFSTNSNVGYNRY